MWFVISSDRPQHIDEVIEAIEEETGLTTQEGLPLTPRPYHAIAESLGLDAAQVMARLARMRKAGIVRRIGAIPNHYRIG